MDNNLTMENNKWNNSTSSVSSNNNDLSNIQELQNQVKALQEQINKMNEQLNKANVKEESSVEPLNENVAIEPTIDIPKADTVTTQTEPTFEMPAENIEPAQTLEINEPVSSEVTVPETPTQNVAEPTIDIPKADTAPTQVEPAFEMPAEKIEPVQTFEIKEEPKVPETPTQNVVEPTPVVPEVKEETIIPSMPIEKPVASTGPAIPAIVPTNVLEQPKEENNASIANINDNVSDDTFISIEEIKDFTANSENTMGNENIINIDSVKQAKADGVQRSVSIPNEINGILKSDTIREESIPVSLAKVA